MCPKIAMSSWCYHLIHRSQLKSFLACPRVMFALSQDTFLHRDYLPLVINGAVSDQSRCYLTLLATTAFPSSPWDQLFMDILAWIVRKNWLIKIMLGVGWGKNKAINHLFHIKLVKAAPIADLVIIQGIHNQGNIFFCWLYFNEAIWLYPVSYVRLDSNSVLLYPFGIESDLYMTTLKMFHYCYFGLGVWCISFQLFPNILQYVQNQKRIVFFLNKSTLWNKSFPILCWDFLLVYKRGHSTSLFQSSHKKWISISQISFSFL